MTSILQENAYTDLTNAYTNIVGSTPDSHGDAVITALCDDTEGDFYALKCWIKILQSALNLEDTL